MGPNSPCATNFPACATIPWGPNGPFWGIFILVISSWVGTTQHPTVMLVSQVVDPYMRPFRNLIPPIGMIDISPMAAIFTLMFIRAKVLPMLGGLIVPLLN